MRTPTMIAIGGAAALAVAWLLLSRTPPPAPPARQPATVVAPAPPIPAPAPVDQPAPSTAPAPVAPPPVAPTPAPPVEPEHKPEPAAKDDPPIEGEPDADATETPADDEAPADDSGPAPIDADHAADLMADWIASEEAAGADDPEKMDKVLKTFDDEGAGDPEWSQATEKKVEAALDEWFAGLPEEVHRHVQLLSVQCRITLCQILAAANNADDQTVQVWEQAVALLRQQPWWNELGFVDATTTMHGNTETGYLLYQTYLMREAPPPQAE